MSVEDVVMQFLRQEGGPFSPKEVADALGFKYETAKRTLLRLYRTRRVSKSGRGRYHAKGTSLACNVAKKGTKTPQKGTTLAYNERDKTAKKGREFVKTTIFLRSGIHNTLTLMKGSTGKGISELIDEALIDHYNLPIYKKWRET